MASLIKTMTVYFNGTSRHHRTLIEECLDKLRDAETKFIAVDTKANTFISYCESNKGDWRQYYRGFDVPMPPDISRFECYVTEHQHVRDADVAYALYSKAIPVLSLTPPTGPRSTSAVQHGDEEKRASFAPNDHPLFHDLDKLHVSSAEDAISKFLTFPDHPGKIFVVEGGDGAGKQTQVALMCARLRKEGLRVATLDFPNDAARYGTVIREVLCGKGGSMKDVNPLLFASLYSLNRHDTLPLLRLWMQQGTTVVLDRYMSANFGHQASKYESDEERKNIIHALQTFEVKCLGLPEPTLVMYLDLPPEFALRALENDKTRTVLDMHERAALSYKNRVRESFVWCCKQFPEWRHVRCLSADESTRLSREEVHESMLSLVKEHLVPTPSH